MAAGASSTWPRSRARSKAFPTAVPTARARRRWSGSPNPSLHERINAQADPVEARKAFIARQPMGRLAKPEEIAPIVVFLASDESAFATGNVYSVDGGMTI